MLFLVFAGLHFAKEFLMPIAIGAVLATLFLPFCKWMERKKVPRVLATLICLLTLLLGIAIIGALLGWQISELMNDFELIKQKALELANKIQLYIFNHLGITADKQWQLLKEQQFSFIGIIPYMASSMASILGNFILILVYLFGILYFRNHIKQFLLKLAPPAQREEMEQVVLSTTKVSQQYLVGLAKMIACLWILYGIGFSIIGVKNALFFAILCGLLEIVPFIGNIVGTSLTLLVAAVHGASLPFLGGIVLTYGIVQLIQGWLLEPMMVGPQVKINPLFTIIALVLGELVWGIPGIFLAIPLTAMFKIICDHVESLKPYGFLIGKIEGGKLELKETKKIITWINKKVGH